MAIKQKTSTPISKVVGIDHKFLEGSIVTDIQMLQASGGNRVENRGVSVFCRQLTGRLGEKKGDWGYIETERREYVHSFNKGKVRLRIETDICPNCGEAPIIPNSLITILVWDEGRFNEVAIRSPGRIAVEEKNPELADFYLLLLLEQNRLSRAAKKLAVSVLGNLMAETQAAIGKFRKLIRAIGRGIAKGADLLGIEGVKEETLEDIGTARKLIRIIDENIRCFGTKNRKD